MHNLELVLKPEVRLHGLHSTMLHALEQISRVWESRAMCQLKINSALDGTHMEHSLHYVGKALDVSTRGLPRPGDATKQLKQLLGNDFDVVLYPTHIHVEYDPKRQA